MQYSSRVLQKTIVGDLFTHGSDWGAAESGRDNEPHATYPILLESSRVNTGNVGWMPRAVGSSEGVTSHERPNASATWRKGRSSLRTGKPSTCWERGVKEFPTGEGP